MHPRVGTEADVVIVEIGGTVGDIESLPFLEAIRQFRLEAGRGNAINVHLTLVPYIKASDELKTKPTQHSVKDLRQIGIQPDILLCRSDRTIPARSREDRPLLQRRGRVGHPRLRRRLHLPGAAGVLARRSRRDPARQAPPAARRERPLQVGRDRQPHQEPGGEVRIGFVGKYVDFGDSYKSLNEALVHGGIANNVKVSASLHRLGDARGRGLSRRAGQRRRHPRRPRFRRRGVEGKLRAIRFAREKKLPFFGICLGMQCATIEFARNVAGMVGANSTEFDDEAPYKG